MLFNTFSSIDKKAELCTGPILPITIFWHHLSKFTINKLFIMLINIGVIYFLFNKFVFSRGFTVSAFRFNSFDMCLLYIFINIGVFL